MELESTFHTKAVETFNGPLGHSKSLTLGIIS